MSQPEEEQLAALIDSRRYAEADALVRRLLGDRPDDPILSLRQGQALQGLGRLEEAVPWYLGAIALAPSEPAPLKQLGQLMANLGAYDQALSLYGQALELAPDDLETLFWIGRALSDLGYADEARTYFERIARLDPSQAAVPFSLARDAHKLGDTEGAVTFLEQARSLAQNQPQTMLAVLENRIFQLSAGPAQTADTYLTATEEFWRFWRGQEPVAAGTTTPAATGPAQIRERLRIGILSADLGNHVVSTFLEAFLEGYRRDRLQVELVATKLRYEVSAERLGEQADARHSLQGLSVEESRALLRAQGYDVLVDTAGFTESSGLKVLAQRCAPVQCHWIGYHASTGLATIDWFLGDEVFTPASLAPQFRERLWRLPRAWLARSPRTQSPQVAVSEAEGRPVFGSFNQLAKLGEATFAYWAAALAAVPEAALVIKSWHTVNPSACQRIREDLAQRGVDPSRLTFRPPLPDPDEHLGAYNGIDIALDATPWSSSSTAFDALSMGVPLVAIQGDCASARMSSSLLSAMDRREWICRDPADFAATVAELCRDLPVLRGGKAERQRQVLASPLFDPTDLAWHVGEAFTAMRRLSP